MQNSIRSLRSAWQLFVAMIILEILSSHQVHAAKIYKSRRKAMSLLSGVEKEEQQYFTSCEQSSNSESCVMAIDEGTADEYSQCAHTKPEKAAYWKGYLENPTYVASVHILNSDWKKMGMNDALLEFTIGGSDQVCYTYRANASFLSKTFPCDIMTSFIEIKSSVDNAALVLCDVKVTGAILKFSTLFEFPPPPLKFSNCDQSSVYKTSNCWLATDDFPDQRADRGACAMTLKGPYQWWSATLKQPALVHQVILINRADCCKEDLTNFAIYVGGQLCARYNSPTSFSVKRFECNVFGSSIKVQSMAQSVHVTLCEVRVHGHIVDMTPDHRRTYLGCFNDTTEDPDFNDPIEPVALTNMELDKCDRMCRRLGKKYFGVQDGMLCWCGNSYGKHGKVDDKECGTKCEGKSLQYCGGVLRNLVFELN